MQQQPDTDDGRLPLPRMTTPTWEVELLLSAGVVFALFQLPDPLHAWADEMRARLGDAGDMLAGMLLAYSLMAVYALIGTFLVHLTARAYWVAMVGIASVYPGGIRWDRFSGGPIGRAEMQRQIPTFGSLVERADNMASLCFAFGLVVVMSAMLGALFVLPTLGIAILLNETLLPDVSLDRLMFSLLALVLLPMIAAGLLDKYLGRHWKPGQPVPGGPLAAAVRFFQRMPVSRLPAPLILMLATNQRGTRVYILFFAALLVMMAMLFGDLAVRRGAWNHLGYAYFPAEASGRADPQYYRDQRSDPLRSWAVPTLATKVADGRWLELLVPYDPERHERVVEQDCAGSAPAAAALAQVLGEDRESAERRRAERQVVDCLGRLLAVRIDGDPVSGASFALSEDPATGLPALLAMIPVDSLPPGAHELQLQRFPDLRELRDPQAQDWEGPLRIPFWR